jgi:hypothetical protein
MMLADLAQRILARVSRWWRRIFQRPAQDGRPSGTVLEELRWRLASFDAPRLSVELVPSTSWGANLRSLLSQDAWDRLRRFAYRRAGYRCEVCGGRGSAHPVECHELWEFDDAARVQRLVGLVALCPGCHAVKHLGRTMVEGDSEAALARLGRINGWSETDVDAYVELVFDIWSVRSDVEWRLDLGWLARHGIQPPGPAVRTASRE